MFEDLPYTKRGLVGWFVKCKNEQLRIYVSFNQETLNIHVVLSIKLNFNFESEYTVYTFVYFLIFDTDKEQVILQH